MLAGEHLQKDLLDQMLAVVGFDRQQIIAGQMLHHNCFGGFEAAAALFDTGGEAVQVRLEDVQGFRGRGRMLPAFGDIKQHKRISQVQVVVEAAGVLEQLNVGGGEQIVRRGPAQHSPQKVGNRQAVDDPDAAADV